MAYGWLDFLVLALVPLFVVVLNGNQEENHHLGGGGVP